MKVVIDSNILFSALIKDSLTRQLILKYEGSFLFPYYIFVEMKKHKRDLLRKSGLSKVEFDRLLELLLEKVEIIAPEVIKPHREQALEIIKDIDINDVLFVAGVLAHPNSMLWSDDKKLKKQHQIKVLNTKEIKELFWG